MKRPKLFIYEHGVCEEKIADEIAIEGMAMFKAMLSFSKYFDLISYVRDEFSSIFPFSGKNFEDCIENCEKVIIVAPEDNYTLLNLTKKIERFDVENLGSSSKAIEITSDKWLTYKKLRRSVTMPKTSLKPLDCEYLVKPRISCGGNGIRVGGEVLEGYIAQEIVKGENLSASIYVGDDIRVLSINEQILDNFSYKGAVVPAKLDKDTLREVSNAAISAVEKIKGLRGYVGVDLIFSDQAYVIEINARLTTPFILFEYTYGMSYADMLWNFMKGRNFEIKLKRRMMLYKGIGRGYVSHNGYAIILKTA